MQVKVRFLTRSIFAAFPSSIPHSEACRTKGISHACPRAAAALVALRALRFKLIEPANRVYGLDNEIFVCVNCGHEQMYVVACDRYAAR